MTVAIPRAFGAAAFLAVCLTVPTSSAASPKWDKGEVRMESFANPVEGEEQRAEVGQTIVTAGVSRPAIEVLAATQARILGNNVKVAPGTYRAVSRSADGTFYQADEENYLITGALGLYGTWPRGGIYVPDDKSAPPGVYYLSDIDMMFFKEIPNLEYRPIDLQTASGGFRREIVYGGVAKGVVSLSYREFSRDMARPAFTQQLTYDLADGAEIGFRGARIKVLEANNLGMRYIVVQPLSAIE